jgi:hypothetical protein
MLYQKGYILLYGGMSNKGLDDDNIYKFTIDNRQWKVLTISGLKPGCRVFHSMNFFKNDSIIIFGGKVKTESEKDYIVANDLVYIDLKELDSSTPFIANIGPSSRFGHSSCYNYNFNPEEHLIIGGLDQTYCSMDVYIIKEIEISEDKKWVYEQKKMHSNNNVNYENKDDIFETTKKTIINYKNQIEELESRNIDINRK